MWMSKHEDFSGCFVEKSVMHAQLDPFVLTVLARCHFGALGERVMAVGLYGVLMMNILVRNGLFTFTAFKNTEEYRLHYRKHF